MVAKSSKLIAARKGRVLLVRRRKDRVWTLPGGKRNRPKEGALRCLLRELREELPALRLGRKLKRLSETAGQVLFMAKKVRGRLVIGDRREIDRAAWRTPDGLRLTTSARVACRLVLKKNLSR